ncbi:hypothetical protein N7G274_006384 [Stereocaulon virgatum]|uniref:Uncharacterized protein n=1 Tax=Stereocaulon virgatum TaxID=373712 RepID=A0ABR4A7P2_9LECA
MEHKQKAQTHISMKAGKPRNALFVWRKTDAVFMGPQIETSFQLLSSKSSEHQQQAPQPLHVMPQMQMMMQEPAQQRAREGLFGRPRDDEAGRHYMPAFRRMGGRSEGNAETIIPNLTMLVA